MGCTTFIPGEMTHDKAVEMAIEEPATLRKIQLHCNGLASKFLASVMLGRQWESMKNEHNFRISS
jgi:hypothetical protein